MDYQILTPQQQQTLNSRPIEATEYVNAELIGLKIQEFIQTREFGKLEFDLDAMVFRDYVRAIQAADDISNKRNFMYDTAQEARIDLINYVTDCVKSISPSWPVWTTREEDFWIKIQLAWIVPNKDDSKAMNQIGGLWLRDYLRKLITPGGSNTVNEILKAELVRIQTIIENQNLDENEYQEPQFDPNLGMIPLWDCLQYDPLGRQLVLSQFQELLSQNAYDRLVFKVEVFGYGFGDDQIIPEWDYDHWDDGKFSIVNLEELNTEEALDHMSIISSDREYYKPDVDWPHKIKQAKIHFNPPLGTKYSLSKVKQALEAGYFDLFLMDVQSDPPNFPTRYSGDKGSKCQFRQISSDCVVIGAEFGFGKKSSYRIELPNLGKLKVIQYDNGNDVFVDSNYLEWTSEIKLLVKNFSFNKYIFPIIANPKWIIRLDESIAILSKLNNDLAKTRDAINQFLDLDDSVFPILYRLIQESSGEWVHQKSLRSQFYQRKIELGDKRKLSTLQRTYGIMVSESFKKLRDQSEIDINIASTGESGPTQFEYRFRGLRPEESIPEN